MIVSRFICCLLSALMITLSSGASASNDEPAPEPEGRDLTVITSDSLSYDAQRRMAVFDGNVVVSDPEMSIEAEQLTVVFGDDNSVSSIQASGNVVIKQDEMMGVAGEALYDVQEGKIMLSVNPKVRRLNDELTGETITFFRATGRMLCEPNATLKLYALPQIRDGDVPGR